MMKRATFAIISLLLCLGFVVAYAGEETILFSDDFATLDPAWGEPSEQRRVEGNKMIIVPEVDLAYTDLYEGNVFGDADIRVKVSQSSGQADRPGGLVFWGVDYNAYYIAELTIDGNVSVVRKIAKGRWLYPVVLKAQHAVKRGLNQENEIRVVTKGNTATVYINEEQVATLKGSPPEGGGMVGMYAESGATEPYGWKFSNFSVRTSK